MIYINRTCVRSCVLVLLLCFGLANEVLFAQNEQLNHEKYWYYRWRFQKSFIKIGDCDGCSIPANQRHHYSWDNNYSDNLKFGDGTISLGTYISVLATEYDLLNQNGQNTLQTRKELYYALLAFNRLDMKVEDCMNMTCLSGQDALNGFFMRDDVPVDFLVQHPELMPANETSPLPVGHVATNYVPDAGNGSNCAEESHDQIINMLMGLKMVSKFVPSGVFYKGDSDNMAPFVFQDGETDILLEAKRITTRMIGWIKSQGWMIARPCGNGLANGGYGGNVELHWAWAFNEIAYDITNNPYFIDNNPGFNYCSWLAAVDAAILAGGCNYFVSHEMTYKLMALGADVYPGICVVPMLSNDRTILANQSSGGQAGKCVFEWMPLMHSIFDNYELNENLWPLVYQDYLNSAPCTGPYAFKQASAQHPIDTVVGQHYPYPSLNVAPYNWSSPSLLFGADKRWTNDDIDPQVFEGEYNGLDYMFMYNLYCIRTRMNGQPNVDYRNLIDYMVPMDLPFNVPNPNPLSNTSFSTIGDDNFPADFFSFTTLKTNKKMENNANASYRAGYEVVLEPGLEIKAGAEMHAYIDGLSCDRSDNYYRISNPIIETPDMILNELIIYPNPNDGIVNIKCIAAPFNVNIYNVLGELIYEKVYNETECQIDLTEFPKAIYLLNVKCNGTTYFNKINKQ